MENQLQTTKGAYLTDLQQLDGETLRNFVDPKHQASPQELQTLLAIVKIAILTLSLKRSIS